MLVSSKRKKALAPTTVHNDLEINKKHRKSILRKKKELFQYEV
jgi:hypothetical protein